MVVNLKELIGVLLLSHLSGISFYYWLQAVINNTYHGSSFNVYLMYGMDNDPVTFAFSLLTSLLAIMTICLVICRDRHRLFGKISMGFVAVIELFWLILIIVYATRSEAETSIKIHIRSRDYVRAVIHMILALGAAIAFGIAGIYK